MFEQLELRLDNVAYRMGVGTSRAESRQLVGYGMLEVNGRKSNIPSQILKVGDVVGVRERSKSLEIVEESLSSRVNYSWLEWNGEKMEGKFLNYPERAEIPENIAEQLIVELYSK